MNYWQFLRILIFFTVFSTQFSFALNPNIDLNTKKTITSNKLLSIELYNGYLNGRAREIIYNEENASGKNSEIFWDIAGAYIVGGSLTAHLFEKLKIGVNGWAPVTSKNTMDDYDWYPKHNDWMLWSHSPDTKLRHAYMFDARAAFELLTTKDTAKIHSALDIIGGYKWLNAAWTAYGASYVYTSENGFRDIVGVFPDGQAGISYEQWWSAPYIGLGGKFGIEHFTLSAEIIKSFWAKGHSYDTHHRRSVYIQNFFTRGNMFGVNFEINYDINSNIAIFTRFNYEKFSEVKGEGIWNQGEEGVDPVTHEVTPVGVYYVPYGTFGGEMYTTSYLLGLRLKL